jgi:MFS family permease
VVAIALYAMSLAPVTWVIISEIFPNRIRGAAMSVSVFALWTASLILTYTFPILNQGLGEGAKGTALTFCVYAGICVLGFFLIRKYLPETKGKSLEELEKELILKK